MPQTIQLETPDHIELEFHLAGLGSRCIAALLDHILQFVLLIAYYAALGGFVFGLTEGSGTAFIITLIVGFFVIWFGYFFTFEWLWNGQTPGKKAVGIRVMRDDGRPLDVTASAIRNLVRTIDLLPFAYAIGVLTAFFNGQSKRLGDLAAGTLVVVERKLKSGPMQAELLAHAEPRYDHRFGRLTREDRQVAVRYLSRREDLTGAQRADLAGRLAAGLAEKAGLDPSVAAVNPEGFLAEIAFSE